MSAGFWAGFALSSLTVLLLPGPTNLLLVAYGLGHGRRALRPAVMGVTLGRATALALAAAGAGALLAAPPAVLSGLSGLGIAYVGWLGLRLLRRADEGPAAHRAPAAGAILWRSWLVTVLNPFNLAWLAAVLPQAMGAGSWAAAALLAATFLALGLAASLLYGLLAVRARRLCASRRLVALSNRVGGTVMIGAAVALGARLVAGA